MFLHDTIGKPQAKAGARVRLCGVERLEDMGQISRADTCAAVGNGHSYSGAMIISPLVGMGDAQKQAPAVAHGVDGINNEV